MAVVNAVAMVVPTRTIGIFHYFDMMVMVAMIVMMGVPGWFQVRVLVMKLMSV